jgi:hypothetical protein
VDSARYSVPPPTVIELLREQHRARDWWFVTTPSNRLELRVGSIGPEGLGSIHVRHGAPPIAPIAWPGIARIERRDSHFRSGQIVGLARAQADADPHAEEEAPFRNAYFSPWIGYVPSIHGGVGVGIGAGINRWSLELTTGIDRDRLYTQPPQPREDWHYTYFADLSGVGRIWLPPRVRRVRPYVLGGVGAAIVSHEGYTYPSTQGLTTVETFEKGRRSQGLSLALGGGVEFRMRPDLRICLELTGRVVGPKYDLWWGNGSDEDRFLLLTLRFARPLHGT